MCEGGDSAPLRAGRERLPGAAWRTWLLPARGGGAAVSFSDAAGVEGDTFAPGWLSGVGKGKMCPRLRWGEAVFAGDRGYLIRTGAAPRGWGCVPS